jgi:cell division initiation protein
MKLTALEIKQQQFEKSLRGYDPAEVQSFLNLISSEWEHMTGKVRELETQVDKLNDKLKHYERVEEALHETLQTAKSTAEEKLVASRREAKLVEERAEMEAESIVNDAYRQRREIRQHIIKLIDKREEIIRNINSYLENAKSGLDQFNNQDPSLFTLPPESDSKPAIKKSTTKSREPVEDLKSLDSGLSDSQKIDDILDDLD